jgi:hypothetical protein
MTEINREQLATVLEQIADCSTADDIRAHLHIVIAAIRGNGLTITNGPSEKPPAALQQPAQQAATIQVRSSAERCTSCGRVRGMSRAACPDCPDFQGESG